MNSSTVFIFTIKAFWLDYRYSKYPGRYNFLFVEWRILLFPSFIVEDFPQAGKALMNNFHLIRLEFLRIDIYVLVSEGAKVCSACAEEYMELLAILNITGYKKQICLLITSVRDKRWAEIFLMSLHNCK